VEERGLLDSTLFSSFDDGVLQRLRALSPKARLAVLVSPWQPKRAIERAEAVNAEALNPGLGIADTKWIDAARAKDLAVYVYTVNESAEMKRQLDAGVDGLFTNYPDELRRWLPLHSGA
jgi:glycerophosphoryl diester phosphodiesterase